MEVFLSSYRKGHGIRELLSKNKNEYWATKDNLPHCIKITFQRKTYIHSIILNLSYYDDESYTPQVMELYYNKKKKLCKCYEPVKPVKIYIKEEVFDLYITIVSNHNDGRDTHVRGLIVKNYKNEDIECISEF